MAAGTWRRPTREDSDSMKTGRFTEKLRIWCSSLDSNIFWGGCRRVGWSPRILPRWSAATSKSTTCLSHHSHHCQGVSQVTFSQMPHYHSLGASSGARLPFKPKIDCTVCCSAATNGQSATFRANGQCNIQENRLELCSRRSHRYRG